MELLHNLQDSNRMKEAEKHLESLPLAKLIPHLVEIISSKVENPEETQIQEHRIMKQSSAIWLKNQLHSGYKTKVSLFFEKENEFAVELLKKLVEILIECDDTLISPHLALTILSLLKGLKTDGGMLVEVITKLYDKIRNNPTDLNHQMIAIESIYDIIKDFSKNIEILESVKNKLDFLWKENFTLVADKILHDLDEWFTKDTLIIVDIFIFIIKILTKVFKILDSTDANNLIKYISSIKNKFFDKSIKYLAILKGGSQTNQNAGDMNTNHHIDLDSWAVGAKLLSLINSLHRLEIYGVEYLALEKYDFELYMEIAEYYFNVSFCSSTLELIKKAFLIDHENSSIESEWYELAEVLVQGIKFHRCILDNPLFWVSDILFGESDVQTTQKIEERFIKYYSSEKLWTMCASIINNYILLTQHELEMWDEDPISFYFQTKELSSDSLLRESSVELIKAIKIRFPEITKEFSQTIKNEISQRSDYENIKHVWEKEALYNFLQQIVEVEEEFVEDGIINMIEHELSHTHTYDKILHRRMIWILSSFPNEFSKNEENIPTLQGFLNKIVEIQTSINDYWIKLTWIQFLYLLYDDYRLNREAFKGPLNSIFEDLCIFLFNIRNSGNMQVIHEILGLFTLLTQKYPQVALGYIEANFISAPDLEFEIKKELCPVVRQLLATIEDEQISQDLARFASQLLIDIHAPVVIRDVFLAEEGMKLLLVYLRRLQNFSIEGSNPFVISLDLFKICSAIVENLDYDEDSMLNIFLVLEEMHFSLCQADLTQITKEIVIEVYEQVLDYCFNLAVSTENSYICLLACYFWWTLIISENNAEVTEICTRVLKTVKSDITKQLIVNNEKPCEHHRYLFNGFFNLFSCMCLRDPQLWVIENIAQNTDEINLLKLITEVGKDFMKDAENLFNENDDSNYDEEPAEGTYNPIIFSVVYLNYLKMIGEQGNNLSDYEDENLKKACKLLLDNAFAQKENMVEISYGLYIWQPLKYLTREAEMGLLLDIPSRKRLISKKKLHMIYATFEAESHLFQMF